MPASQHPSRLRKTVLALAISAAFSGCQPQAQLTAIDSQQQLHNLASQLQVHYQVLDNRTDEHCDKQLTDGLCFRGQFTLSAADGIQSRNWAMYFSDMTPIQSVEEKQFIITHLNGDLHKLEPGPEFTGLAPGETANINFRGGYWHLSKTDIMPNYYLVSGDLEPETVTSTQPRTDADSGLENLPHAGEFTDPIKHLKRSEQDSTIFATSENLFEQIDTRYLQRDALASAIIPTPQQLRRLDGELSLAKGINLQGELPVMDDLTSALEALQQLGINQSPDGAGIHFRLVNSNSLGEEGYTLAIGDQGIKVGYQTATGAAYALRSLASLLFIDSSSVPHLEIQDSPRFAFRGMHLDVARNFRDKDYVLKLLEQMARYKLNRLHLHLGDDEGWRVEINDLPELTDIGSQRCHNPEENRCLMPQLGSGPHASSPANGYYTRADYIDILQAARARQIEVIPSFDMPGHSRAAVVAMEARYRRLAAEERYDEASQYRLIDPQDTTRYSSIQFYQDNTLNVCLDSSYHFVGKVIDEVMALHREAGVALTRYHIGADETAGAWLESPACQALLNDELLNLNTAHDLTGYFVERVANLVAERGIVPAGWNDGMSATTTARMPATVQSNAWTPLFWDGHKAAHEQANRQWQVVISTPDVTYFDFPHAADPLERGYYWASRGTSTQQVFEFMPANLPAQAEFWGDRQNNPMSLDDRHSQLQKGMEFYGLQGHLWTEVTRTDAQADYMIFPRLIALAERAWHQADWELPYNYQGELFSADTHHVTEQARQQRQQEWNHFANVLGQKELPKLDQQQIAYRIPTVGAKIQDGSLHIRSPLPGLTLQYRFDDQAWTQYTSPIEGVDELDSTVQVRALASDGRPGRALTLK